MNKMVKYEPKSLLRSVMENWGNVFSPWEDYPVSRGLSDFTPHVDIVEKDKYYLLSADLPGLTKEDISIDIEDDVLTIKGERKFEKEDKGETYHTIERHYGMFQRAFEIPNVVKDKIKASFKDGVLEVHLPKTENAVKKQLKVNID